MTRDEFWRLIERTRAGADLYEQMENLEQVLAEHTPEELIEFSRHFDEVYTQSYTWDLWGAAYIINGGCSDDGFDYFRGWLIAQGKDVFEKAMAKPDSLADYPELEEDVECEDILYLPRRVYEEKTGEEMPSTSLRYPELGESWDFDDNTEMESRYPKLYAMFWGEGAEDDEEWNEDLDDEGDEDWDDED